AFEGCAGDHTYLGINDLGFRAVVAPNGSRGFRVTAGGGTAILVTNATVIHEFLPTSEIFRVAEALLRVFRRYGDYQHKQRNRMKFMIRELGWGRWRGEYDRELTRCRMEGVPILSIDPPAAEPKFDGTPAAAPSPMAIGERVSAQPVKGPGITPTVAPVYKVGDDQYARWRATNVRPQKTFGFTTVIASVPLGDLTSAQMRVVADLARAYGDG